MRTIDLPDGYNGHTIKFNIVPEFINEVTMEPDFQGNLIKLKVAESGKEYMSAIYSKEYLKKNLSEDEYNLIMQERDNRSE